MKSKEGELVRPKFLLGKGKWQVVCVCVCVQLNEDGEKLRKDQHLKFTHRDGVCSDRTPFFSSCVTKVFSSPYIQVIPKHFQSWSCIIQKQNQIYNQINIDLKTENASY